jgi:NAD(P)H-quinone oxidoreductase subunit 5
VVLLTNALTSFNLVRVFRQVFLDQPHPKTKRSPEVNWLMALPMISLAVLVVLTPLIIDRIDPLEAITAISPTSSVLVLATSLVGLAVGWVVRLDAFWSRSLFRPLRLLQDLLAFDFYTERIYKATIVAFVAAMARLVNSVDRVLVNGLVNRIGSASLASAEGLKLGVSGQLQSYVLTLVAAILILLGSLAWLKA